MYSEFAVWIVLGQTGLLQYEEARRRETEKRGITDIGCFHDGERALKCVKQWIDHAFDNKRNSDHVTKSVLRKMVDEMLYPDADACPTAKQLKIKAKDIFETARGLANSGRSGSMASDSTGRLTKQLRPNKKRRRRYEPDDDNSDDESDAPAPAVPSPSRRSTHMTGGVQSPTSLNSALVGDNVYETPYHTDADESTEISTSTSTTSTRRKQSSPASMHGRPNPKSDRKYAPEPTQSPDAGAQESRFPHRNERHQGDITTASTDSHSPVIPTDDKEVVKSRAEHGHGEVSDMIASVQLVESPSQIPAPAPALIDLPKLKAPKPELSLDRGIIYYSDKKAGRSPPLNDDGCMKTLADPERDYVSCSVIRLLQLTSSRCSSLMILHPCTSTEIRCVRLFDSLPGF